MNKEPTSLDEAIDMCSNVETAYILHNNTSQLIETLKGEAEFILKNGGSTNVINEKINQISPLKEKIKNKLIGLVGNEKLFEGKTDMEVFLSYLESKDEEEQVRLY